MKHRHTMPFGAEVPGGGGTRFRPWAPGAERVTLETAAGPMHSDASMTALDGGWFEAIVYANPPQSADRAGQRELPAWFVAFTLEESTA